MAPDTLQWRFVVPTWWQVAVGLVVLAWGFSAAANVSTAWKVATAESTTRRLAGEIRRWQADDTQYPPKPATKLDPLLRRVARRMVLFAAAYVVLGLYFAYAWVRALLVAKRGRVVVAPEAMEITDWRGRKRHLVWADIQQASLTDLGGLCKPPRVALRLNGRTMFFPVWLVAPQKLLLEIVTRAGLTNLTLTWYQQRYVRPGGAWTADAAEAAPTPPP